MKCAIDEQKLYLLSDGLLDDQGKDALLHHCASCPRCRGMYEEARRSLDILKQPEPKMPFLPLEKERAIISAALAEAPVRGRGRIRRIIAFPKREYLYAAAAAIVLISVVAGIFLAKLPRFAAPVVFAHAPRFDQERIANFAKDTTIGFSPGCKLQVTAGADVSMRRSGPRVVHFSLTHGGIFIAAHKGLYDTIAVDCRSMIVLATGTHFSVLKNDSSVSVSVLEGSVRLSRLSPSGAASAMVLSSLETCSALDAAADWQKMRMPDDVQNQLTENFAAMGCSDCTAFPVTAIDDAGDFPQKSPVSTTTGTHGEIRKLMRKGYYDKAIAKLNDLVATRPRDPDIAYCDLALCYCKTDQWDLAVDAYAKAASLTNDKLVREAILHRTNHILFSKLLRYAEAEKGIRSYLALYPHGTWRQRELGLLARVERAQKRH
jgi:ferric-dicitrate binding protein FerR (iron transport regulator)